MEPAIRRAQWAIYGMAVMIWLGALAFVGYRIHQMGALKVVEAEVLDAKTTSYMGKSYSKDATGWTVETRSRMYSANATVRYQFQGREYIAEASHDVGISFKWVQDRLTRQWKPGSRILIHIDPAKPDQPTAGLGFNLNTFTPAIGLVIAGFLLLGVGYGLGRLPALLAKFEERFFGTQLPPWRNR